MIFQGHTNTLTYAISLKDTSFAITVGDQRVIACDRGGRLYTLYDEGYTFRRGLDGRILQKWQGDGSRERRWLDETEADALMDSVSATLRGLLDSINSPDWRWTRPPDPGEQTLLTNVLERAAQFDSSAARADAQAFNRVYRPLGILPPDQYLALVLQATEGCSFNTCAFCDLYRQPYRVKTPVEFDQHIADVRRYLGGSITLRQRSIFLGAANALGVPMPRLAPLFESIGRAFDISTHGVYAFVDGFTGTRKSADDYRVLADLGLRRVYMGLESGHDPLLEFVRKPGFSSDAVETVRVIKSTGVSVAVIVMIGLGGDRFAEGHVADTVRALHAMQLGDGDLIYFSDLVEEPDTQYPALATQCGIRRLTHAERAIQREAVRSQLAFSGPPPKFSNYDIREFVY